jgi:hypothetical protein
MIDTADGRLIPYGVSERVVHQRTVPDMTGTSVNAPLREERGIVHLQRLF